MDQIERAMDFLSLMGNGGLVVQARGVSDAPNVVFGQTHLGACRSEKRPGIGFFSHLLFIIATALFVIATAFV